MTSHPLSELEGRQQAILFCLYNCVIKRVKKETFTMLFMLKKGTVVVVVMGSSQTTIVSSFFLLFCTVCSRNVLCYYNLLTKNSGSLLGDQNLPCVITTGCRPHGEQTQAKGKVYIDCSSPPINV